jgi:hypothetical protein
MLISPANLFTQETKDVNKDYLKIGGAFRMNVVSEFYESGNKSTDNYATIDIWRINVDASKGGVDLSFEYRWYPIFGTNFIHHGYFGYAFSDAYYLKIGVCQVPFGVTKYASHSWWFQAPYYVGLEDDYDMGAVLEVDKFNKLKLTLGYFRQAEPEGPSYNGRVTFGNAGPGRFSYDITPGLGGIWNENTGTLDTVAANIRELNQFNIYTQYYANEKVELGGSAQLGGIYNSTLEKSTLSYALAAHLKAEHKGFTIKSEYVYYNYASKADNGEQLDIVQMGAYGFPYNVANVASIYAISLAHAWDLSIGPLNSLQVYIDYSFVDKTNENFYDTQHLIPGILMSTSNVFAYLDFAMGKSQPWLTDTFGKGLGVGVKDADWNLRINFNIGYYF